MKNTQNIPEEAIFLDRWLAFQRQNLPNSFLDI